MLDKMSNNALYLHRVTFLFTNVIKYTAFVNSKNKLLMKIVEKKYQGFGKGYGQLAIKDKEVATQKLWKALGVNNRNSFWLYKTGKVEPKLSQAQAVEAVFTEYGITEIWD
jgi:hypothetical protein